MEKVVGMAIAAALVGAFIVSVAQGDEDSIRSGQVDRIASAKADTAPRKAYQRAIFRILRQEPAANRLYYDIVYPDRGGPGCARQARRFHAVVHTILDQIRSLSPPAAVRPFHRAVVSNGQISASKIGAAAVDATRGELACGRALNRRIYGLPSTSRAERAIERIEAAGYFIFGE